MYASSGLFSYTLAVHSNGDLAYCGPAGLPKESQEICLFFGAARSDRVKTLCCFQR